jgi:hypothetical protein
MPTLSPSLPSLLRAAAKSGDAAPIGGGAAALIGGSAGAKARLCLDMGYFERTNM